jgi:hypothetical protein
MKIRIFSRNYNRALGFREWVVEIPKGAAFFGFGWATFLAWDDAISWLIAQGVL